MSTIIMLRTLVLIVFQLLNTPRFHVQSMMGWPSSSGLIMNIFIIIIMSVVTLLFAAYLFLKMRYKYWEMLGIPGPKPAMWFGNYKDAMLLKTTEPEMIQTFSNQFSSEKYYGIYLLWKPIIVVKDLDIVKRVTEKDFIHFVDHPEIAGKAQTDSVLISLFTNHGNDWKVKREYFSKLFTPKKLKEYSLGMNDGIKVVINRLDECARTNSDIELFRFLEQFAVAAITSSMFGLELWDEKEVTDRLLEQINSFQTPPAFSVMKFLCYGIAPKLFNFLKLATLPEDHWNYCSQLTNTLIQTRKESGTERNDCLDFIMKLVNEGTSQIKKITYEEAVGHISAFLQAGTHTSLVTMTDILHKLAQFPDIQQKARQQVDDILKGSTDITYEQVSQMTYLDYMIIESNRLGPQLGTLKRVCTKDYKLDDKITIKKGDEVYIDGRYIHYDPKYFPRPELFLPERWSTKEAEPSAIMGFGKGPRICIGKRLAEMEIKITIAAILKRFVVLPSEKMKPIKYDPKKLFITTVPIDGIWVKLKRRE